MARPLILTNFTAGEFSPYLEGRPDVAKYFNACKTLENMIVFPQGGAERRPGTIFVAETKDSSKRPRIKAFEFSTLQAYIIEFGEEFIRFCMDHGQIESGGNPYEIASPYQEADLPGLRFTQSADVLYIVHPDYAPRKLSRLGHTSWTLAEIEWDNGPFLDEIPNNTITITPSATTGNITLTASSALFESGHVGAQWALRHVTDQLIEATWSSGNVVSLSDYFTGTFVFSISGTWVATITLQRSFDDGSAWEDYKTYTANASATIIENEDGVMYRAAIKTGDYTSGTVLVRISQTGAVTWGYARITAFTSDVLVSATVVDDFSVATATDVWKEGAWSSDRGYPSCTQFYQDRLWFANTDHQPSTLWASKTGDYENMEAGDNDDSALNFTLSSGKVDAVIWIHVLRDLIIGTSGAEYAMSSTNDSAITPTNVSVRRQTVHGSSPVEPVDTSNVLLYLQRSGRTLREIAYNFTEDGYDSPNRSIMANHIAYGGIVDMAFQQEPHAILWCVRADGVLLGLTYMREEQVMAWHRHPTDGQVESIAVISVSGGDELWMSVKRTINGTTRRYIEYLSNHDLETEQDDWHFVDCGLVYDGAPATAITGLDHLESETVSILADGAVMPNQVVVSGQVTLTTAASVVHVGLPYTSLLETMRLETGEQGTSSQARVKKISEVWVRLLNSLGGQIGPSSSTYDPILYRDSSTLMDSAPTPFTGDKKVTFPGGMDRDARVVIRQDQPYPMTVLSIMPRVDTFER